MALPEIPDSPSVDLGPMPLDFAHSLQYALKVALGAGAFADGQSYHRVAALKAKLDFEVLRAENPERVR